MDKKKFSTFSYKLVQISPIMILVNSGAFISSWFCELTELIFVMIPYISSSGYPPPTPPPPPNAKDYGYVQVANVQLRVNRVLNIDTANNLHEGTKKTNKTCAFDDR